MADEKEDKCRAELLELVKRLRRGDHNAFREVVQLHEPSLRAFVGRRLRTGDDNLISDVVQLVWVQVMGSLGSFSGAKPLGAFIMGVAKNVCNNEGRRMGRDRLREMKHEPEGTRSSVPEEIAAKLDVTKAIGDLPEDELEVLTLRFRDRWTLEEISEELGKPVSTVHGIVERALDKIKPLLRGWIEKQD